MAEILRREAGQSVEEIASQLAAFPRSKLYGKEDGSKSAEMLSKTALTQWKPVTLCPRMCRKKGKLTCQAQKKSGILALGIWKLARSRQLSRLFRVFALRWATLASGFMKS